MRWLRLKEFQLSFLAVVTLLVAVAYLTKLASVLFNFSFIYSDMDQALIWYETFELRNGRIHSLRFFGQNYGSILEAVVAFPMVFLPYNVAVPLATVLLTHLPFFAIYHYLNKSLLGLFWILVILCLMPLEYAMITSMPRDLVTGIAMASLSLFFFRSNKPAAIAATGFFATFGWSLNQNATILSVLILTYSVIIENKIQIRRIIWVIVGTLPALLIHFGLDYFFKQNPELVTHHAWQFSYSHLQLTDGLSNLDRHFKWVTPLLTGQGWALPAGFLVLSGFAFYRKRIDLALGTLSALIITIFSLGVLKVHDGYESIFLSHERMFLALPVCLAFISGSFRIASGYPKIILASLAIVFAITQAGNLQATIDRNVDPELPGTKGFGLFSIEQLETDCEYLAQIAAEQNAEAIIIYPNGMYDDSHNYACSVLQPTVLYVQPGYERKHWDFEHLDQARFEKVLLITARTSDQHNDIEGVKITNLYDTYYIQYLLLLEGNNFNPIEALEKWNYPLPEWRTAKDKDAIKTTP